MRFIHKAPTNFHISQYVVEIGMRWLWDLQGSGGDSSWNYNLCYSDTRTRVRHWHSHPCPCNTDYNLFKTLYCTLFLYEFFLT